VTAHWTERDVRDLSGEVVIVTGANSGIGFETARALARKGAETILACRDLTRGDAALDAIRVEDPSVRVEAMELDLASLRSVRRFAETFRASHDRLDALVNNAGVLLVPYDTTEDGFERHFGVNHLGHFAVTGLLIDRLITTPGSRVVTVTSAAQRYGRLDFDDLMFKGGRGYSPFRAYARSKLAALLFAFELQRRLAGPSPIAVAAHPGGAATDLGRRMSDRHLYRVILPLLEWLSQSAAEGARPVLRAATDPDLVGGECVAPGGFLGMRGHPVVVRSGRRTCDWDVARRLWTVSEELTGVQFL